ncbi:hypothetical protein C8R45DRAFT_1099482 [Mycena sanguinolenta]|nr:hypothetical protein C8R45DRAFT_1099482 [Mycena sanguinolenta]
MSFIAQWKTCGLAPSSQTQTTTTTSNGPSGFASRAVITRLDQLWETGSTVTYSFLGGTANQQAKVDKVVLEWLPYANLNFQRVSQGGLIRITFDATSGSWSWVGTLNLGLPTDEPTMNLGWIKDDTTVSADDRAVILHEFGHVLGLLHEYFMPAEMDKERIEIKPNYNLSEMDKAYMVINYPRTKPHESAKEWTLEYALLVAGVSKSTALDMLAAQGDPASLRSLFTAAQVSARLKAKLGY